jgi:hypothetical protein
VTSEGVAFGELQAPGPARDAITSESEGARVRPANSVWLSGYYEVYGDAGMHSEKDLFPELKVLDGLRVQSDRLGLVAPRGQCVSEASHEVTSDGEDE